MSASNNWAYDGFHKGEANVEPSLRRLHDYVHAMEGYFQEFTNEERLNQLPGKWSRQEILGHLIDSAINNLKRFTEIQFLPQPYRVIPYSQENLVVTNNYQHLPLSHLLTLWKALNQQIIYVADHIPKDKLDFPVDPGYQNKEIKTLGWIICDYVAHLEHHLAQIRNK